MTITNRDLATQLLVGLRFFLLYLFGFVIVDIVECFRILVWAFSLLQSPIIRVSSPVNLAIFCSLLWIFFFLLLRIFT